MRVEGEREAVVTNPVLEEVAQYVERVGPGRRGAQEPLELRDDRGARLVEVEVGNEKSTAQARSAFSITTAWLGTFWWPPALPVATFLILSTVSLPSTTLPNTA